MSDSKYKDLLKRSFSIIPQPFIEKAEKGEPLADKDLELLQSKKISLDENVTAETKRSQMPSATMLGQANARISGRSPASARRPLPAARTRAR